MAMGDVTALGPVRAPVKFIAELFEPDHWNPKLAIADSEFSRQYNIFAFSIAPLITDPSNYWITWGGWFDNPTGRGIQIFMNMFLTQVFIRDALTLTENSFWVDLDNDIVYINTSRHPWQYLSAYASLYGNFLSTFATAPKDENNPSDNRYGPVTVKTTMEVPSLRNSLNDIISGVNTVESFEFTADNSDGFYDEFDIINYFNTPLKISKTSEDVDTIEEFEQVRFGIVSDIKVDFDRITVEALDQFFLMTRSYCRVFSADDYPNIGTSDIGKDMAVAWGPVTGIEPTEVDRDTSTPPEWIDYIALDPEYITSVQRVYDSDGNELDFTFDDETGIIRVTELDGYGEVIEASTMDVTGRANNSIGEIIIDALAERENIQYLAGVYDIAETDYYLSICPSIGYYFGGGTTRELIDGVLKNDNAFLIQKNNGLITIRRWGETYETWQIPSWLATQQPKKNFADATKYYASTVKVRYGHDYEDDAYDHTYVDDTYEAANFERYRRSYTAVFDTDLLLEADASDLAARLLDRFGNVRETLTIGLGVDTFCINPLDRIEFVADINDRRFSSYVSWIVKSVDTGQDTIEVEGDEIYYQLTFDGDPATIDGTPWYVAGIE